MSSACKYKVFVCTHINTAIVDDPIYELLHTGRAFDQLTIEGIRSDDMGDNISFKKDIYDGLLTGMYWIWKNTDYEYVGLSTYRAYLGIDGNPLRTSDMQTIFQRQNYDLIVARADFDQTISEHFRHNHLDFYYNHLHDPLAYAQEVIEKKFPNMKSAFEYVFYHNRTLNPRHTLIAKRECFNLYAKWLFEFIEYYLDYALNRKYPIAPRFFGYLMERMERVWVITQSIKILEMPLVYVSDRDKGMVMR